jgi:hypothetical protein
MCEFCEAICGHHFDGCPKNLRAVS